MLPKNIIIIYKTDTWHTHASREIIGITDNIDGVLKIIKSQAKKECEKLTERDVYLLQTIKQTQEYAGTGEFLFEEYKTNTLL